MCLVGFGPIQNQLLHFFLHIQMELPVVNTVQSCLKFTYFLMVQDKLYHTDNDCMKFKVSFFNNVNCVYCVSNLGQ